LVGVGWVNSVSGSTSGVIMGRALTGSGGEERKSLGSRRMSTIAAMWRKTEATRATLERPREAGSLHSVSRCSSRSSTGGPTVSIHQPRFWRLIRSAPRFYQESIEQLLMFDAPRLRKISVKFAIPESPGRHRIAALGV